MATNSFAGLEQVGQQVAGDQLDPNEGTIGGQNSYVFTRTFKVNSNTVQNYLFQIIDATNRITDATITNAYLVKQRAVKVDETNLHLVCVFAQVPNSWSHGSYQTVPFPGVQPSSLYPATDFIFRNNPVTRPSQVRHQMDYFLGPLKGIPTYPVFQPTDFDGNRISTISDFTNPSSDLYISMALGRQEIVIESTIRQWKGDIYVRDTTFAIAA